MLSTHYAHQILIKLQFWEIFKKFSNYKFHANPTKGSQVVSCRHTDRNDGLTVTFRNFLNAAKNGSAVLNTTAI